MLQDNVSSQEMKSNEGRQKLIISWTLLLSMKHDDDNRLENML